MSIWSDISGWMQYLNPFHDIATGLSATEAEVVDVAHAIGFFEGLALALTDPGTWISLGWLLLGIVLILVGVWMWVGKGGSSSTPSVVPVPVPV